MPARAWNGNAANYLSLADPASGDLDVGATDSAAWAVWMWLTAAGGVDRGLYAKKANGNNTMTGWLLQMIFTEKVQMDIALNPTQVSATDPTAISAATWYHFLATLNRGDNLLKLFKNGTEVASVSSSSVGSIANSQAVKLGQNSDTSNPFDGRLAHAAMWKKVAGNWTAGEIEALKQSRFGIVLPTVLVHYVPVVGASPEPDLSGKAYNMTLNGSLSLVDGAPVGPYVRRRRDAYYAAQVAPTVASGGRPVRASVGVEVRP